MKLSKVDIPINQNLYIMGIDQSFTNTGITILKQINKQEQEIIHSTCISTSMEYAAEERMFAIINFILEKCRCFCISAVAIESPAYQVTSNNGRLLSGLFFSLLTHFLREEISYFPVNPKSLKKFATGSGGADKKSMREALSSEELKKLSYLSGIKPTSKKFEDIVDSFWLAKYGCLFGDGKKGSCENN